MTDTRTGNTGLKGVWSAVKEIGTVVAAARHLKPRAASITDSIGSRVEQNARSFGNRPMILFEGKTITWAEFNALANRYAHGLAKRGVGKGDTVSLLMENRIEYLAAITAVSKLGAIAGLINTNLRERPLIHCINVTESKLCIIGEELVQSVEEVKAELNLNEGEDYVYIPDEGDQPAPNWTIDLAAESADLPADNPASTATVTLGDSALYLFTSGTTGLPKAAVVSHRRYLMSAITSSKALLKCNENDRIYICLPLYHGTGLMIGFGPALASGASMVIRRKFSASRLLDETREHQATCLIYIGELCRYLLNQPVRPDDADNPLRSIAGNGLRPDIWIEFKQRFGIERIAEFYGASEGNVAFANLLNKQQTIGTTTQKIALVRYDVDEDEILRDDNGHCIETTRGEPGLLLAEINDKQIFEGYTNSEDTEKKIIRDVRSPGDSWFNSGDLIRRIDVGFSFGLPHFQFVDRVGDTYRWKSENVSTNEVGEVVNRHPQVHFCNVYGVEVARTDGRAGMAALVLDEGNEELDIVDFSAFIARELPAYARPVFLRIQRDIDITGTFKMVKGELRKQGYDPELVGEPLYVMKPGTSVYEPLDADYHATIRAGTAGF
jgi:citronellyl-CoA synthetase